MKKFLKGTLSLLLAVIMVISVAAPALPSIQLAPKASAATFNSKSTISLVDPNTHKTASTQYMYGNADYLCLKLVSTTNLTDEFTFVLYSDANHKNVVASYTTSAKKGTKYINLIFDLTKLKTKTYYAVVYVKKYDPVYRKMRYDESTKKSYTIKVNKKGTSLNKMNTVMYGHENTDQGPRIYWFSVPGATGYYVYRRNPDTGKYVKIGTAKKSGSTYSSYVDKGKKGKSETCRYKVVAYNSKTKTPISLESIKIKMIPVPKLTIAVMSDNRLKISWPDYGNQSYCELYRRSAKSEWELVGNRSGEEWLYVDCSKLNSNTVYYYSLLVRTSSGAYAAFDTKGKAHRYMKAPKINAATYPETGGVTVNWDSISGADSYKVYRRIGSGYINDSYPKSKYWECIATVPATQTSFTDQSVSKFDPNYYTVNACVKGVEGSYKEYGRAAQVLEQPVLKSLSINNNQVELKWAPANKQKVESYNIYKKTADGWQIFEKNYIGKGMVVERSENTIIESTYTVQACREGVESSTFDENGITLKYYPEIDFSIYNALGDNAVFSCSVPKNSENTRIYRKTQDTEYELLYETTDKTFRYSSAIENDVQYTYKVVYVYNGVEIESAAVTKNYCFCNNGSYELVEGEYSVYESDALGYYIVSLINCSVDEIDSIIIYEKDESGEWVHCKTGTYLRNTSNGTVPSIRFPRVDEGIKEYAVTVVKADGVVSKPVGNTVVIDANNYCNNINIKGEKDTVTFTWDPETVKADKVLIYSKDKLVASVDAGLGTYKLEGIKPNFFSLLTVRTKTNKFTSFHKKEQKYIYLTAPDFNIKSSVKAGKESSAVIKVNVLSGNKYYSYAADRRTYVYRKKLGENKWVQIGNTYDTQVEDYTLEPGATYVYTARVKISPAGLSPCKEEGIIFEYLNAPVVSRKQISNGIKLSWKKVKKATGYEVWRKEEGNSLRKLCTLEADKLNYTDSNMPEGVKCVYYIKAISANGHSDYSKAVTHKYLAQPKITKLRNTSKGIEITHNTVKGVNQYYVYRKAANETKWTRIMKCDEYVHIDTTAKKNVKYTYTVKAVSGSYSSTYNTKGWSITRK